VRLEPERDVLGDGEMREQRVVLEDDADVALVDGDARDVCAVEANPAPIGSEQAGDDAEERGLAAPRGTEERDELAGANL
jgi:hypothetical protein